MYVFVLQDGHFLSLLLLAFFSAAQMLINKLGKSAQLQAIMLLVHPATAVGKNIPCT